MEKTQRFYDFCIPFQQDNTELRAIIKEAIRLGYKTIALEQVYDHSKRESTKRAADIFPPPKDLELLEQEFKHQVRLLQRLTIIYADASVAHAMNTSQNLKRYHLIAGQPKTDAALNHCCSTFLGDIITIDTDSGTKLFVNRKTFQIGVKRGIFFEIKYAIAISDSSQRKDMIKLAHSYCVRGKSKNVIISSGATNPFHLRGPFDVANLAFIFGLSEDQGKNAVDKTCRQLFVRAESRRIGKTVMFVRASGPIVFSDSSDGDTEDGDMDAAVQINKENNEISKDSSESEDEEEEPSVKKKKLI